MDGGVHVAAATRFLLSAQTKLTHVSGFSALLQSHLPPHDTLNGALKTASGVSGTFSISYGTTFKGTEYVVAGENGTVTVSFPKVTVARDGAEPEVKDFTGHSFGVGPEVKAFAEAVLSGVKNPLQAPEEALRDMEIIEALLQSNGNLIELKA